MRVRPRQVMNTGKSHGFPSIAEVSETGEIYGAGTEQRLHLVKPQQDLGKLAKGNSRSLPLHRVGKGIFLFCNQPKETFGSPV